MTDPGSDRGGSGLDEDAALRSILSGTAGETGERFFKALVTSLAGALGTCGAWVTEYRPELRRLRAMAFWLRGQYIDGWEYDIDGTPCAEVVGERKLLHVPEKVADHYPGDPDLREAGAEGYLSMPLIDADGDVIGNLAVIDDKPMPVPPRATAVFKIFGARALAEMQRLRAEAEVAVKEEKLRRFVDGALDAIIEFDGAGRVTRVNPAAVRGFAAEGHSLVGLSLARLLKQDSHAKLTTLCRELGRRPENEQFSWVADGLTAERMDGATFPAEASLSRFVMRDEAFFTLILRNVNERLEAERQIKTLKSEAAYLREELQKVLNVGEIEGESDAILQVLRDIAQVAETDTTVLVQGETGTGKELVARAIHAAGPRSGKPLIVVNCGAIPATLIESEFFGHERGAFTGATDRRVGRFALADGGTIVLDEVGELPLELQPKLLRVLQQRTFEPVGSSRTRAVDVRVIAATNRDLAADVKEGRFRQDLFYRLSVFPIRVPPLRERGTDVLLLADMFARRYAAKLNREILPLDRDARARLLGYHWPGNVRELENVIERAVITSRGGRIDLSRALPDSPAREASPGPRIDVPIYTDAEFRALERENICRALEAAGGRVSGSDGAAERLGIRPSTLRSRLAALGIQAGRSKGPERAKSRTSQHDIS